MGKDKKKYQNHLESIDIGYLIFFVLYFIIGNIKLCLKLLAHLTLLPAIRYTDCILHVSLHYSVLYELQ